VEVEAEGVWSKAGGGAILGAIPAQIDSAIGAYVNAALVMRSSEYRVPR